MTSFALYGPAHRRSVRPRNRVSPGRSRAVRDDGDEPAARLVENSNKSRSERWCPQTDSNRRSIQQMAPESGARGPW